ncbi:MAG: CRISPR system precrRNA processing endoribonuclease RAMP protein Cas6 [Acaryochloris sp. RU_4_1]|nr:CRISPR system precrRNA processing endoribonuclease RAMP protein Cas6 [Leptolyngbyaceae cyanobacterium SU_3_3]NJM66677.1 CRISPR system precrRNA processing endoribonuclease RAMP protein Cas6 [Acaryochloris sp. RU_4_1]NJR56540.1 CRISPR system precrRNA processing endoribonuclease RAMP protein Cas6 [Acaryochloris sp. CRU_2_0]
MLIRTTWTLNVTKPTLLPRSYGLELIKQVHQRLGIEIGSEQIPSTTCSGILGNMAPSGDFLTVYPNEYYQLSLCGLRNSESKAIASFNLINNLVDSTLDLLGASFHILDRVDETTSYESLYHSLVADEPESSFWFALTFITPTAFAQDQIRLPLPVPALMFHSWLERWNHFAPVYLGSSDLIDYLAAVVAVSQHKIQTRRVMIHQGKVTGFTGEVSLNILSRADPLLANVANLLIHYAQFAGTGMKTRLGMGQTKIKEKDQK